MMDDLSNLPLASHLLPVLTDSDREQLHEAVSELFHRQAILRDLPGEAELYDWARLHLPWVKEICQLIGFEVAINEDDQLIYALPRERVLLRKLRAEWTLVLLGLWYDYDIQVRAEGPPVIFSVETFNDSLKTKLGERMPAVTSLREILAFFAARKLVRIEYADDFPQSRIEVLPTIRLILPFGEFEKVAAALTDLMDRAAEPEEPADV